MSTVDEASHLALLSSTLGGGGVERCLVTLAGCFAERGHRVDLVLTRPEGTLRSAVPSNVRIVPLPALPRVVGRWLAARAQPSALGVLARPVLLPLRPSPMLKHLHGLVGYLKREKPDALLGAMSINYANLAAIWARRLSGVSTRVVLTQPTILSRYAQERMWRKRHLPDLARHYFGDADERIAVSQDVASDLAQVTGLASSQIQVIPNPVVTAEIRAKAKAEPDHSFFSPGSPPVVLAAGRLHPEKDFATLLRAVAKVRENRPVRLIVLGEGAERDRLEALAQTLGLDGDLSMPGFEANPFAYMRQAAVFVSTSVSEGFGNAIVEALACGCPVVSTRCPGGPSEILDGGRYGRLVEVGDVGALAAAIEETLENPPSRDGLRERGLLFSAERSADRYLEVLVG